MKKILNRNNCVFLMLFIIFLSIFLICNTSSDKVTLDEVRLKDNEVTKKQFAMYVQDSKDADSYSEYIESTVFPNNLKYSLNIEKSKCMDSFGSEVKSNDVITLVDNKITVTSNKTLYCSFYFDLDNNSPEAPVISSIVGSKEDNSNFSLSSNYTHTKNIIVSGNWSDNDVTNYCITEGEANICDWKQISETTKNITNEAYTLENEIEGEHIIKLYIQDMAGNISTAGTSSITLDTVNPTVSTLTKSGDSETQIVLNVTASDGSNYTGKEIKNLSCSSTSGSCSCPNTTQCILNNLTAGKEYTITVTATDKSGRTGSNSVIYSTKALPTASEILRGKVGQGSLKSSSKGDLKYRYVGTKEKVTDNYICFGTTNKDDCKKSSSNYLYRIIGVDTSDRLKIIKDTALSTSTSWHSSTLENAVWDSGDSKISAKLYIDLNTTTFLNNPTYFSTEGNWKEKISNTNWYIGDSKTTGTFVSDTGDNVWKWEHKETASTASKIGLMYLSDYYYSLDGSGSLNCYSASYQEDCKTSWLHLTNNGLSQSYTELTMSRLGQFSTTTYYVWRINSNGKVYANSLGDMLAVRPVFYLTASTSISSGIGTLEDPYIVN